MSQSARPIPFLPPKAVGWCLVQPQAAFNQHCSVRLLSLSTFLLPFSFYVLGRAECKKFHERLALPLLFFAAALSRYILFHLPSVVFFLDFLAMFCVSYLSLPFPFIFAMRNTTSHAFAQRNVIFSPLFCLGCSCLTMFLLPISMPSVASCSKLFLVWVSLLRVRSYFDFSRGWPTSSRRLVVSLHLHELRTSSLHCLVLECCARAGFSLGRVPEIVGSSSVMFCPFLPFSFDSTPFL